MPKRIPEFGAAFSALLAERGLSLRDVRDLTGVNHVTISDMRKGYVPGLETFLQVLRGLGLDAHEWLPRAEYDLLPESPADWFWKEVRRLSERTRDGVIRINFQGGSDSLTWEDARIMVGELERLIEAGDL